MYVSTTNEIADHTVIQHLALVRGISVRSRGAFFQYLGRFQLWFGGSLSIYKKLAEVSRHEAFQDLVSQAQSVGANGIVGMRYDATEIMSGVTEVLAYGTAVKIEPAEKYPAAEYADFAPDIRKIHFAAEAASLRVRSA